MPVKVLEAQAVPVNDASEYVATLKSRDSAVIMPQVEGQITQIFVHSGDRVEAGSPLIEIDPLKQQATVKSQESARAAQEAQLSWAKKQYERTQGLSGAGVVSKQDLDQAKSTLDAAQSQMDALDCTGKRAGSATALLQGRGAAQRDRGGYSGARGRPGDDHDTTDDGRPAGEPGGVCLCADRAVVAAQDEFAGAGARQQRQSAGGFAGELYFSAGG